MSKNINDFIKTANENGFEEYGSFNEGDQQHLILTSTKGELSGEVIDFYYDYESGEISKIEHSTQFKGQESKFRFIETVTLEELGLK
jgi:hypothetical protein